jgi:uncharacterized delta-60 repeat protein
MARLTATTLDPTFGADGVASATIGIYGTNGRKMALQGDGKAVVCGRALNEVSPTSYGYDVGLARFDTAGNLDPTFGAGGKQSTDIGSSYPVFTDDWGNAVVVQPDQRIVVAGSTRRYTKTSSVTSFAWYLWDVMLLRYLPNGSLDTDFGTNGVVIMDLNGNGNIPEGFNDVALQSDNKIVAVGYTMSGMDNRFLIMRFHPDGTIDTSFGAAGTGIIVEHFAANTLEDAYSLLVMPDDSIAVVGRGIKPDGNATLSLLKLTASGRLDTTFNSTGKLTMSVGARSQGLGLATDGSGHILVSGNAQASSSSNQQSLILRFNPNGTLDSAFNGTGIFTASFGEYPSQTMTGLKVGSDGGIIAAGVASSGSSWLIARLRVNDNGSADESFGPGGMATTTLAGASNVTIGNCAIQGDGKLLLAGGFQSTGGQQIALLRYSASGSNTRPDGIPMDWIVTHFGSNENAPDEVVKDGRSVSLLLAYLMGENPLDPQDFLRIRNCGITQDELGLEFPTLAGRAYQIESNVEIAADGWNPEGGRILGDGTVALVLLPMDESRKFYRVAISLP